MAWVTTLGPSMTQVEYRLSGHAGCGLGNEAPHAAHEVGTDVPVGYRLDDGELPLEWIGYGLREVGITCGTVMTVEQKQWARALMSGTHPQTGDVLVAPKVAVDPRAKLPAVPLLEALNARAHAAGVDVAQLLAHDRHSAGTWLRTLRGVALHSEHHRISVGALERMATTAGIDLAQVYDADALALARRFAAVRVPVGNRGYDLTFDLPKSYSVLFALANPVLAKRLEETYLEVVRETVGVVAQWAAYGMRGHHGDGHTATRVGTSGFLGWMMTHRTARPVGDAPPDPHLHAHVVLANLVRGTDGHWSTVAAGGRDLHRHARAADHYLKARLRQVTRERFGLVWQRDAHTGAWEVTGIPEELRDLFSKRTGQVQDELMDWLGLTVGDATVAQVKTASARSRQPKAAHGDPARLVDTSVRDLRTAWAIQASGAGFEPAATIRAAAGATTPTGPYIGGRLADISLGDMVDEVAAWVFRPEDGLTAHTKVFTRADLLAEVMHALPLLDDLQQAEQVADAVAQYNGFVIGLPDRGQTHLSNHQRYTTADITGAERLLLQTTRDRYGAGIAVLQADRVGAAAHVFETTNGFTLSGEQNAVLRRLTTAGHGVDAVIGVAGSGKTTIMSVLRSAYTTEGKTVAGVCVAAVAAQNLQAETGIASATVASLMYQIRQGPGLSGVDVLVIDEAAMVDDRHLAVIVEHAQRTRTKVVAIGDPMQLRAPGVGGGFAAIHQLVDGLELSENRRQRSRPERQALALWRQGKHRAALNAWADAGRIHTTMTAAEANADILTTWNLLRQRYPDVHDRIANLLLLAGTNAQVDTLNAAAQQLRLAAGELTGRGRYYVQPGRGRLNLYVGDQVMLRINQRHGQGLRPDGPDVLNGYRGVVRAIDAAGNMTVQWRHTSPDGPALAEQTVTAQYVRDGGVSLGYAHTVAKAQGLTTGHTLVYGNGLDPHTLYPAMSRNRETAHLWLSLDELETDTDRARHGPPATAAACQHRAIAAYTRQLAEGGQDRLVLAELEHVDLRPPQRRTRRPETQSARDPMTRAGTQAVARATIEPPQRAKPQISKPTAGGSPHQSVTSPPAPTENSATVVVQPGAWRHHRHGELTDAQLQHAIRLAEQHRSWLSRLENHAAHQRGQAIAGQGPAATALHQRRQHLIDAAHLETQAAQAHQAHQQTVARINELRHQAQRNRLALRLSGSSRADIEQQIRQLQHIADQHNQAARTAEDQARPHQQAAPIGAHRSYAEALTHLNATWHTQLDTAISQDLNNADIRHHPARLTAITQPVRDLDELHTEQQRRWRLTLQQTAAENTDRTKVIAAQATLQNIARAATRNHAAAQSALDDSRRDRSRGRGHER